MRRKNGPRMTEWQRSGWAPYCNLLVRFKSSMRERIFSLCIRILCAFCCVFAESAVSCSSCSAQPRMRESGVRMSWLTPAIQLVRAVSLREIISLRFCSCALGLVEFFRQIAGKSGYRQRNRFTFRKRVQPALNIL